MYVYVWSRHAHRYAPVNPPQPHTHHPPTKPPHTHLSTTNPHQQLKTNRPGLLRPSGAGAAPARPPAHGASGPGPLCHRPGASYLVDVIVVCMWLGLDRDNPSPPNIIQSPTPTQLNPPLNTYSGDAPLPALRPHVAGDGADLQGAQAPPRRHALQGVARPSWLLRM